LRQQRGAEVVGGQSAEQGALAAAARREHGIVIVPEPADQNAIATLGEGNGIVPHAGDPLGLDGGRRERRQGAGQYCDQQAQHVALAFHRGHGEIGGSG
jgi:hypothetical protein